MTTNKNDLLVLEIYNKTLRDDLKRVLDLISLEKENVSNQRQYKIRKNILTRIIDSNGHCNDVSFDLSMIKK